MFYEFTKKKSITFGLIILILISGISATHNVKSVLGEDYLTTAAARTELNIKRLVYDFKFTYKKSGNLFGSIMTTAGLDSKEVYFSTSANQEKAKSVPVLLYHGIVSEPDGENVLLSDFEIQMTTLKNLGWNTVSMEDFYSFIKGEKELPAKSFLLTFDDGRKDSYYSVDPILKVLDYRAVNFIITGRSLEEKNKHHPFTLTKWELEDMLKTGRWEIQSHGKYDHELYPTNSDGKLGHFLSNKLWLKEEDRLETEEEFIKRIQEDLSISKRELEDQLNIDIFTFAFPFSDFGQDSINFPESTPLVLNVVKSLYHLGFYQIWEGIGDTFNYPSNKDFSMIKRITLDYNWKTSDLVQTLEKGVAKPLPYNDDLSTDEGWTKTWGKMKLYKNSLVLGSLPDRSGGSAFLDGSYSWKGYAFSTKIEHEKGYSFSLLARYQDDKNYVACIFSPEFIKIEQVVNDNRETLASQKINAISNNIEAGIKVNKDNVDCLLNGSVTTSGLITNPILGNGGIAIRTWDPTVDNSQITVKNISVVE